EATASLHVDLLGAVHEYVRDRSVAEQRFDWSEPDHLVHDLVHHAFALRLAERRGLPAQELRYGLSDLLHDDAFIGDLFESFEIEALDQPAMELELELLDGRENRFVRAHGGVHAGRRPIRYASHSVCGPTAVSIRVRRLLLSRSAVATEQPVGKVPRHYFLPRPNSLPSRETGGDSPGLGASPPFIRPARPS